MDDLSQLVRRVDEDRWLASRFAPAVVRERLIAIYAVNYEIARTAETVSELGLGAIRLEWWREALEEIAEGVAPRQQPALTELARVIKDQLHAKLLQGIVAARSKDFEPAPFASWDELNSYVDDTAGVLLDLCIAQCAAPREPPEAFVTAAGRAWGYTGLLRAETHWHARGRSPLPNGATRDEMVTRARRYYAEAQGFGRDLPSEMFPAIGYLVFVPGYLRRSSHPLLLRQARIITASATGAL